jgi:iron complex outermembrane receptor protein/hemoglobin/transferrin/lactoferrin receptor protein
MGAWLLLVVLSSTEPSSAGDAGVTFETTVAGSREVVPEERATSVTRAGDFFQRLPRSMPDALRFEPGVSIQQTAHGQASPYVRGLTGQQTVLLFDGIRLNTSTWRLGPNQYGFTVDPASLAAIEVLRSGGSTRFGSDALGGVIAAQPLEAPTAEGFRPSLFLKATSADSERGGRAAVEGAVGTVGFVGGVGVREVGLLESAGRLNGLDGAPALVPRLAPDGRTQLGTGFKELTGDGRVTWRPGGGHELTLAGNVYRQFDSPRTDQCPPPSGGPDDCLTFREQFRSLVYAAWVARPAPLERLRATVSWQRQHEDREGARPSAGVVNENRDTIDTLGLTLSVASQAVTFGPFSLRIEGGADSYLDFIASEGMTRQLDTGAVRVQPRGQYIAGSTALTGGVFADARLAWAERVILRAGGRLGWVSLAAPGNEASATNAIGQQFWPLAGHVGLEWRPASMVGVLLNVDQSYRAPNLDDLTARQQTGAGFVFENPALTPERATTAELGVRVRTERLTVEAWAFQTWLVGAVGRQARDAASCPPETPQCTSAAFRYQLVNLPGVAELRGSELSARLRLPLGFGVRGAASYVWGEGAAPGDETTRVPLGRIPPLHGLVEASWRHELGFGASAVLRAAGEQRRLAATDRTDPRIPPGGTPGYALVDLRAWARVASVRVSLVVENLFDSVWRVHGSSINGPGRGVMVLLGLGPPPAGVDDAG